MSLSSEKVPPNRQYIAEMPILRQLAIVAYPIAPGAINILYVTGLIAVTMPSSVVKAACRDRR